VIENEPSLPVVTVEVSKGVDAPRSVVIFAAYNWIVAPETGCCPPCTTPEIFGSMDTVGGPFRLPRAHPERKRKPKERAK
jgi:hypothetical protein